MTNLEIIEFEKQLAGVINGSQLPCELKRLVVKDMLGQLEIARNQSLAAEIVARKEKSNEQDT